MTHPLPYHCPTLNGNFFKPPCERQIEMAKEKREKSPNAMIGFLEKCLECKGKALVKREGTTLQDKPLIVSDESDLANIVIQSQDNDIDIQKSDEKAGFVQEKNDKARDMTEHPTAPCDTVEHSTPLCDKDGPPDCQNERENMTEIMTVPSPIVDVTPLPAPPRCPKHPNEPQVQCGPDSKRAGQYLGACKVCMAERKLGKKPKEKMTPAVARDLGIAPVVKKDEPAPPVQKPMEESGMAGVVSFKTQEEAERVLGAGKIPEPETPTCTRPDCEAPGSPIKIDKLGRSMGMCQACVSARGRRGAIEGHTLGKPPAPVSAMLNEAKYTDLREWLTAQADENERTLLQEIMYRLKLAMREARTINEGVLRVADDKVAQGKGYTASAGGVPGYTPEPEGEAAH